VAMDTDRGIDFGSGNSLFADYRVQSNTRWKTAYLTLCALCHGTSAKGDGPVAPHLNQKPADLTRLATANDGVFPYQRVYAAIDGRRAIRVHSTREMPVWGMAMRTSPALYHERIHAIVDYLASLQGK